MAICIEMLKISTSALNTFFHVQIMVSNAIPLLFGNYDAHITYMWDIHLKKVLKNVNYIKREFTDTHTNTLSPSPPLNYFIIITFDSFAK